jgi:NAD(P)-dependent dehydrogenase (short-subunit alcohol dehydrogenase family)
VAGSCASKAGVRALCDAFRVELRPVGIRVTTLCPGGINTRIADHVEIPDMPPRLTVEDAVRRMPGAIARGKKLYTFPAREAWLVRLLRYLPLGLSDWMVGRSFAEWQRSRERAAKARASQPPP